MPTRRRGSRGGSGGRNCWRSYDRGLFRGGRRRRGDFDRDGGAGDGERKVFGGRGGGKLLDALVGLLLGGFGGLELLLSLLLGGQRLLAGGLVLLFLLGRCSGTRYGFVRG